MPQIDLFETQEELKWIEKKLDIKANRLVPSYRMNVRRGEVYGCDFGYNLGSEMRGYHPCVILQNNAASSMRTAFVAPITHASSRSHTSPSLVPIARQVDSRGKLLIEGYVDVAGARSVSKARLTSCKTTLPAAEMKKVDVALASLTDLYGYYKDLENKYKVAEGRGNQKEEKIKALRTALQKIEKALPDETDEQLRATIRNALNL